MSASTTIPRKVIIVGGGFGGLSAAKVLSHQQDISVTLVDRRNYYLFQPLLYQVATAGLSPAEIAAPIRSILAKSQNVEVVLANTSAVLPHQKKIKIEYEGGVARDLSYDYLILACGAKHSYFGHPEWEEFAPGLKTLEQATEIRRRVLTAFELAENETDPEKQREHLTFVVIGGGPTGVELAGALAEISRTTLKKDFRHIDSRRTRVILVEAGDRILPAFEPTLSARASQDLEKLGVQVWTQCRVTQISESQVSLGEEKIKASTILWAAGVEPSSLSKSLGVPLDHVGRAVVKSDCSIPNHPEVFVIGDQASFLDKTNDGGKTLPGLSPVAMQQGRFVAEAILSDLRSKPREAFQYVDKGQMATIGRKRAILQKGNLKMSGFLAWLGWLFVHIYYLIGFKNRLVVFLNWAWSYFTYRRGARLIVSKEWRSKPQA